MLIEVKKLNIINEGHQRRIFLESIFINPVHIISVRDYSGARDFLISEGSSHMAEKKYSLIKLNNVNGIEEIIALGSSEELSTSFRSNQGKRILND